MDRAYGIAPPGYRLPDATPVPHNGRLGLYHFAILLPDRAALGVRGAAARDPWGTRLRLITAPA